MHLFDRLCRQHSIEHRLTKPNHPWTNGQVERMNRTIKDATVKRYHYADHQQLTDHLELFVAAYNHARRLKTLKGFTPHQYVCRIWTEEPERFKVNPYHHTPGLNSIFVPACRCRPHVVMAGADQPRIIHQTGNAFAAMPRPTRA